MPWSLDQFKRAFWSTLSSTGETIGGTAKVVTAPVSGAVSKLGELGSSLFGWTTENIESMMEHAVDDEEAPLLVFPILGALWAVSKTGQIGSYGVKFVGDGSDQLVSMMTGNEDFMDGLKSMGRGTLLTTTGLLELTGQVGTSVTDLTLGNGMKVVDFVLDGETRRQLGGLGIPDEELRGPGLKRVTDFGTGVLESLTTTPHKALELYFEYREVGVTPESVTKIHDVVDDFIHDVNQPQELRDAFQDLLDLGNRTIRDGGGGNPNLTQDQFVAEIFHGAHVVSEDDGDLYDDWAQKLMRIGAATRGSSHYDNRGLTEKLRGAPNTHPQLTDDPQIGIDLPTGGHLLFGTCWKDGTKQEKCTWFQTEGMGMSAREFIPHMSDWVLHMSSGKAQVGPEGLIYRSEKTNTHLVIN